MNNWTTLDLRSRHHMMEYNFHLGAKAIEAHLLHPTNKIKIHVIYYINYVNLLIISSCIEKIWTKIKSIFFFQIIKRVLYFNFFQKGTPFHQSLSKMTQLSSSSIIFYLNPESIGHVVTVTKS